MSNPACPKQGGGFQIALFSVLFCVLAAQPALATILIPATGGELISADTANTTFTLLSGLVLDEQDDGDIGLGTVTLTAPAGFVFDASATVQVEVTRIHGSGSSNRNINEAPNGTLLNVTSISPTEIVFTVLDDSDGNVWNRLTWQNVRVTPSAGTPLANGSILLGGTSEIEDVPANSSAGNLAEITGIFAQLILSPASTAIEQGANQTYAASGADQFGNALGDMTVLTVFWADAAAGGSWAANTYVSSAAGTWTVWGNASGVLGTATLTVTDITPPVITLLGTNPHRGEAGIPYADPGAEASDDTDGNITAAITTTSAVNASVPGNYSVMYAVNDSAGNNATASRTVEVVDTTPPVIALLGDASVDMEEGQPYSDAGAVASDIVDGNLTGAISVSGSVSTGTIGTYTLTYSVQDSSGNAAEVSRTVDVQKQGGIRRGRLVGSYFAASTAPAAGAQSASPESSSTSATSAGSEGVSPAGTSSQENAGTQAAPAEQAPRTELPGIIERRQPSRITGAVTGTRRGTSWLWFAGLGALALGALGTAWTNRDRIKRHFSE